ncbi:hypothetical protein BST97_10950 [Nonlabens spongiae]|uniref:MAM domain-containing protein n=1 Tax=Nonlabens spongiae TaxID=331648 RepID=A0A1W6MLL0_9FLAO|nr:T9SS type A sorting domain-containing protein [Nonlabens spongiae]ARN78462.1 hypothetical protein BST97_10950 [Nonlabens spongiae]
MKLIQILLLIFSINLTANAVNERPHVKPTENDCTNEGVNLDLTINSPPPQTIPYIQDFDNFPTGPTSSEPSYALSEDWTNEGGDSFDWTTDTDNTGSGGTGPSADNTTGVPGQGTYLYLEASGGSAGRTAVMTSPYISLDGAQAGSQMIFWYHMLGSNIGSLEVDIRTLSNPSWTQIIAPFSDNVDLWQRSETNLDSYLGETVQFRFTGTTGNSFDGDIGFDDFAVIPPCTVDVDDLADQTETNTFTFPAITGSNLTGNEMYYTASRGRGTAFAPGQTIQVSQFIVYPVTLYIYGYLNAACYDEEDFQLTFTEAIAPDANNILYVDKKVTGGNETGNSWTNALPELADALLFAKGSESNYTDSNRLRIHIAGGTYKPLYSPEDGVNFGTDQDRDNAFLLVNYVELYGGFASGQSLAQRDLGNRAHETVLSGDFNNDDVVTGAGGTLSFANNAENAYHIVVGTSGAGTNIIDGVTINGGNADLFDDFMVNGIEVDKGMGGGIYIEDMDLKLTNCKVLQNFARSGGGIYVEGRLDATNCLIAKNLGSNGAGTLGGGGIQFNFADDSTFSNCTFYGNEGRLNAGALAIRSTDVAVDNCVFWNNSFRGNTNVAGADMGRSSLGFANFTVTYSLTQENSSFQGTDGINNQDPKFIDPSNDDFRLLPGSPVINTASNAAVPVGITTDAAGNTRIFDTTVDMGALENQGNIKLWTGVNGNDGIAGGNYFNNTAPAATDVIVIPGNGVTNYPTIDTPLTVDSIVMQSGSSLIANATVNASVKYTRNLPDTDWHLIAAPVAGETQEDIIAGTNLATGTGSNIGVGFYSNNTGPAYIFANEDSTGPIPSGGGISIKLAAASNVNITGTINSSTVTVPVTVGTRTSFNLLGNPFTSYLDATTFLNNNTSVLGENTVWLWNGTDYETFNLINSIKIAPAQGFFVEAGSNGNVSFATSNQSHNATDTFKSGNAITSFELTMSSAGEHVATKVFFDNRGTTGFDNGYDSTLFADATNHLELFTGLVANDQDMRLAIQTLSRDNMENNVIPVGVIAGAGDLLEFSIGTENLPTGLNVYLEDRLNQTLTLLEQGGAGYSVALDSDMNATGRFFIQMSNTTLGTGSTTTANIKIFTTNDNNLRITGLEDGKKAVAIYSLLGKEIVHHSFNTVGTEDISLPLVSAGIYIVNLQTEKGQQSQKILIQ